MKKFKAIIVDLDGTVADAEHRLHHIKNGNRDWKSFFDAMVDDTFMPENWAHVKEEIDRHAEIMVLFVTARPDSHLKETVDWLTKHFPDEVIGRFTDHALLMREAGDHRPDTEVKAELYEKHILPYFDVVKVFEDRPSVQRMYTAKGLDVFALGDGVEF